MTIAVNAMKNAQKTSHFPALNLLDSSTSGWAMHQSEPGKLPDNLIKIASIQT